MNNLNALLEMSRQHQKMMVTYKGADAVVRMMKQYQVMNIYKQGWAERLVSMARRYEAHLATSDAFLRKMKFPVKMDFLRSVMSRQAELETKVTSISRMFSEPFKRQSVLSSQHNISA